jgi:hypothetical protein
VRRKAEAARAALQQAVGSGGKHPQQQDEAQQERLSAKEKQEREKQREIIRQQYLGQQKQKRRIAKASDKFRCVDFHVVSTVPVFTYPWDTRTGPHSVPRPFAKAPHCRRSFNLMFSRRLPYQICNSVFVAAQVQL